MPPAATRAPALQLFTRKNRGARGSSISRQLVKDVHRGAYPLEVVESNAHIMLRKCATTQRPDSSLAVLARNDIPS